jgi:hypothetical protein
LVLTGEKVPVLRPARGTRLNVAMNRPIMRGKFSAAARADSDVHEG